MTFGTGVGGGIVIDGRLLSGASGLGGELGHIPVKVGGAPCVCGGRGCLELEASGRAIALAGQAKTSAEVVSRAQAGDTGAVTVLTNAGCAIGTAVKILVPAVGPETVVLTGALAHGAGDFILPAARSVLDEDRPLSIVRQAPRIEIGRLGPYAGAIGAAELARSATPALAPSSGALD
jgi:glucokinase